MTTSENVAFVHRFHDKVAVSLFGEDSGVTQYLEPAEALQLSRALAACVDDIGARKFTESGLPSIYIERLSAKEEPRGFHVATLAMITAQRIADLMVTAIEGGINYWCGECRLITPHPFEPKDGGNWYADAKVWGGDFTIRLVDTENAADTYLTRCHFEDGLMRVAREFPERFLAITDEQYDAEDADVFVQLAAFREVRFG
jgi:hypothetical protein